MKKKVMAFGTFDILHPGHSHALKEAKKLGDYLVVIVARDATVEKVKGKKPMFDEKIRLQNLKKLKIADKVRLGNLKNKYQVINDEKPDVIALGYDQNFFVDDLRKNIKSGAQIVRLKPFKPEVYKSSKIKEKMLSQK